MKWGKSVSYNSRNLDLNCYCKIFTEELVIVLLLDSMYLILMPQQKFMLERIVLVRSRDDFFFYYARDEILVLEKFKLE